MKPSKKYLLVISMILILVFLLTVGIANAVDPAVTGNPNQKPSKTELETRLDTLEQKVLTLESDNETLKAKVATLEAKVSAIESEHGKFYTDLVGVVSESGYYTGKRIFFSMVNKEGQEVPMSFDIDDVALNGNNYATPMDFVDALTIGDGRTVDNNDMLVVLDPGLDSNGVLNKIDILIPGFARVGDSQLDENNNTIELRGTIYNVTQDTTIFDMTGDFDSREGGEINNVKVITWDSLKDYNDSEDLAVGFLEDGIDVEYLFIIGPHNANL